MTEPENEPEKPPPLPDPWELMSRRGPFGCTSCGVEVGHPMGVCARCSEETDREDIQRVLTKARETITGRYRWAKLTSARLRDMVGPAALQAAKDYLTAPRLAVGLAIVGPPLCGKSSLAAAMLRWIHDSATSESTHAAVERARGAYFVPAVDLLFIDEGRRRHLKGDDPEMARAQEALHRAAEARVLVLDGVKAGADRDPVCRMVLERYNSNRPTIVTTHLSKADVAASYGGDLAARLFLSTIAIGGRS